MNIMQRADQLLSIGVQCTDVPSGGTKNSCKGATTHTDNTEQYYCDFLALFQNLLPEHQLANGQDDEPIVNQPESAQYFESNSLRVESPEYCIVRSQTSLKNLSQTHKGESLFSQPVQDLLKEYTKPDFGQSNNSQEMTNSIPYSMINALFRTTSKESEHYFSSNLTTYDSVSSSESAVVKSNQNDLIISSEQNQSHLLSDVNTLKNRGTGNLKISDNQVPRFANQSYSQGDLISVVEDTQQPLKLIPQNEIPPSKFDVNKTKQLVIDDNFHNYPVQTKLNTDSEKGSSISQEAVTEFDDLRTKEFGSGKGTDRNVNEVMSITVDGDEKVPVTTQQNSISIKSHDNLAAESRTEMESINVDQQDRIDTIKQIVQKVVIRYQSGQSLTRIQLKPEILGGLNIEIISEQHQITVRMTAESAMAKDIIEQNFSLLKNELQHHGLEIQKFDVNVQNSNDSWNPSQQYSSLNYLNHRSFQRNQERETSKNQNSTEVEVQDPIRSSPSTNEGLSDVDFFA